MKNYHLIALIFGLLLTQSCKKHPEGGYQFRNKHAFFTSDDADWDLKHFIVDGIDSTEYVCDNSGALSPYIKFQKYSYSPRYFCHGVSNEFDLAKTSIAIPEYTGSVFYDGKPVRAVLTPSGMSEKMTWNIRRCTKKDLILEGQVNDRTYRLEFVLH